MLSPMVPLEIQHLRDQALEIQAGNATAWPLHFWRAHGASESHALEVWCLGDKLLGQFLKDFLRLIMMVKGQKWPPATPTRTPGNLETRAHTHTHFIALGPGLLFPLLAMPPFPWEFSSDVTLNSKLSYCLQHQSQPPKNFLQ